MSHDARCSSCHHRPPAMSRLNDPRQYVQMHQHFANRCPATRAVAWVEPLIDDTGEIVTGLEREVRIAGLLAYKGATHAVRCPNAAEPEYFTSRVDADIYAQYGHACVSVDQHRIVEWAPGDILIPGLLRPRP